MLKKAFLGSFLCFLCALASSGQTPVAPVGGREAAVEAGIQAGIALATTFLPTSSGREPRTTPTPLPGSPLAVRPDWSSVDAIVAALYASVSHGPEYEPNWARMRSIFLPVGMLIPPKRPNEDMFTVLDVDGFRDRVRKAEAAAKQKGDSTAFFEKEVARRTDCFGNVCQIFSTYEARRSPSDEKPFVSGINSIQLVNDGERWWVASIVWDTERPGNPIPEQYRAK